MSYDWWDVFLCVALILPSVLLKLILQKLSQIVAYLNVITAHQYSQYSTTKPDLSYEPQRKS